MNLHYRTIPVVLLLGACAQQLPVPAAAPPLVAPPAAAPAPAAAPPRVVTLPGAICDQARTAETIMRVQLAGDRLIQRVQSDPDYGGAWYEHAPCYRLVLAFTDGRPRQWVADAAAPELRPYIAFGRTKYRPAEREAARIEIMAALAAVGLRFSFFVEGPPSERFTIGVRTPADAQAAMQAVPARHRADVSIFVGDIDPRPER